MGSAPKEASRQREFAIMLSGRTQVCRQARRPIPRRSPTCRCINHSDQVVAGRFITTPSLNRADRTYLIDNEGGCSVKALYALVFVLFSFAANAQALETWIAAYYL